MNLLCESGREVAALGRSSKPTRPIRPACHYIGGDYGDRELLKKIMTAGCEVIDLAYSTVPKTSHNDAAFDLISKIKDDLIQTYMIIT